MGEMHAMHNQEIEEGPINYRYKRQDLVCDRCEVSTEVLQGLDAVVAARRVSPYSLRLGLHGRRHSSRARLAPSCAARRRLLLQEG